MKHGLAFGILLSLLFAMGCSQPQQVRVTYRSDPPGGALYKLDGELWGECPKVLYYDIGQDDIEKGYLDVKGLEVKWPTGPAKKCRELIRITVDGTNRQVTFVQPANGNSTVTAGDKTDE